MNRRDFVALVGGVAAWPVAAYAQQPTMPIVGYLNASSPGTNPQYLPAFRQGLAETGYVEGKNVSIEYRWADDHYAQLPALAADLVSRHVNVLAATGGPAAALSAKAATTSIPVVFTSGADPVAAGLVASLNRPGGNVTGMSLFYTEVGEKRLGLLREVMPKPASIAFLVNPNVVEGQQQLKTVPAAARAIGQELVILNAGSENEIDAGFMAIGSKTGGLLVASDPFFSPHRRRIVDLAATLFPPCTSIRHSSRMAAS